MCEYRNIEGNQVPITYHVNNIHVLTKAMSIEGNDKGCITLI